MVSLLLSRWLPIAILLSDSVHAHSRQCALHPLIPRFFFTPLSCRYVEDIVRSTVPKMELDMAFEAKEELAHAIRDSLQQTMGTYGYTIIQSLVLDIRVDEKVKTAMNEINASKRLREAAAEKAEADKIVQVKAAEASAESKYLNGMGIARERKAIVDGLRGSVEEFSETVEGATPKDVMDLILLTQYFDMLKASGSKEGETPATAERSLVWTMEGRSTRPVTV